MWASRFAPSLTFFLVAATLAFATAHRWWLRLTTSQWSRRATGLIALIAITGYCWHRQLSGAPDALEFYVLQPQRRVATSDIQAADRLFARYAQERRPGDAVTASPTLFRYADYRSFYWMDRLEGRPKPVWVLYDYGQPPAAAVFGDYDLIGQSGRFALFRSRILPDAKK